MLFSGFEFKFIHELECILFGKFFSNKVTGVRNYTRANSYLLVCNFVHVLALMKSFFDKKFYSQNG